VQFAGRAGGEFADQFQDEKNELDAKEVEKRIGWDDAKVYASFSAHSTHSRGNSEVDDQGAPSQFDVSKLPPPAQDKPYYVSAFVDGASFPVLLSILRRLHHFRPHMAIDELLAQPHVTKTDMKQCIQFVAQQNASVIQWLESDMPDWVECDLTALLKTWSRGELEQAMVDLAGHCDHDFVIDVLPDIKEATDTELREIFVATANDDAAINTWLRAFFQPPADADAVAQQMADTGLEVAHSRKVTVERIRYAVLHTVNFHPPRLPSFCLDIPCAKAVFMDLP